MIIEDANFSEVKYSILMIVNYCYHTLKTWNIRVRL